MTAAWTADAVLATLAVLNLLVTLLAWRVYRRQRGDLDAPGAEVVGQLHASCPCTAANTPRRTGRTARRDTHSRYPEKAPLLLVDRAEILTLDLGS